MDSIALEAALREALDYNVKWFADRSDRHKRAHHVLQLATIFLPLVTMLVELNFHIVSLNLTLLFVVSILASLNLVLTPLDNWRRFKRAQIELGALKIEFESTLLAAGPDTVRRSEVVTAFTSKTRDVLLKYAQDHFEDLERHLDTSKASGRGA